MRCEGMCKPRYMWLVKHERFFLLCTPLLYYISIQTLCTLYFLWTLAVLQRQLSPVSFSSLNKDPILYLPTWLMYYTILLKVHCICHCKHTHKSTRILFSYFIVYTSFSIILRRTTNSKKESISLYCKPL